MSRAAFPINVLFGLPDDGKGNVRPSADRKSLIVNLPGTVSITPYLSPTRFNVNVLYVQRGHAMPVKLGPGPLLNHVADADVCAQSLAMITRIVDKAKRPCFNPPRAIAATTRDAVASALRGIDGLIVPRALRVRATMPSEIHTAIAAAGLRYPLLVRVAGHHAGMELVKVERPEELSAVATLERGKRTLYATEFYDFASEDGRYRKYRIAVVGDEIFLRHVIIGESWLLHAGRRAKNTHEQEERLLADFEQEHAPRLRPVFREIADRLQLDYFGVDCALTRTGELLLFEANACMNILENTQPSPNMWDAPIARILGAIETLLVTPSAWRSVRAPAVPREAVA